jgi:TPR repeat protein
LAWFILGARENNAAAMDSIGFLYYNGLGVPKNHLCALKWRLKAVQKTASDNTTKNIGTFFENGNGVPLDKYKALE